MQTIDGIKVPWLVQRIALRHDAREHKFEYMGSAEFEFGAIPKAARRWCDHNAKGHSNVLTTFQINVDGKDRPLYAVIAETPDWSLADVQKFAQWALDRKNDGNSRNMKEMTCLRQTLDDPECFYGVRTGWWCIDEEANWAFFTNEICARQWLEAITAYGVSDET